MANRLHLVRQAHRCLCANRDATRCLSLPLQNEIPTSQHSFRQERFSADAHCRARDDADASRSAPQHSEFETEERLPDGITRHSDFFGEAVTFVEGVDASALASVDHPWQEKHATTKVGRGPDGSGRGDNGPALDALASFDGMAVCILSRGAKNLQAGAGQSGPDAQVASLTLVQKLSFGIALLS